MGILLAIRVVRDPDPSMRIEMGNVGSIHQIAASTIPISLARSIIPGVIHFCDGTASLKKILYEEVKNETRW